jgi:hypothetical protein
LRVAFGDAAAAAASTAAADGWSTNSLRSIFSGASTQPAMPTLRHAVMMSNGVAHENHSPSSESGCGDRGRRRFCRWF